MDLKQGRDIMKAFVESQFGYCPLIWMFHSRELNNKINRIHERALRITYKDKSPTFQELLKKDNSVSIHHRNVQKACNKKLQSYAWFFSTHFKRYISARLAPIQFSPKGLITKTKGKFRQTWHRIHFISWTRDIGSCTQ